MKIALTYNLRRSRDLHDEREAEFDSPATVAWLAERVLRLGHEPALVEVTCSVRALEQRLRRAAPDLVLNLAEGRRGPFREAFCAALLEEMGIAHTGSGASALALCLDKALANRVVAAAGVTTPRHTFVREVADLPHVTGPLIVKPNYEGSSKGITQDSVVGSAEALRRVATSLLARYPAGLLVEELVDGADVSVAWVAGLGVLPPIGYAYDSTGRHSILDYDLKHLTPERVRVEVPARLPASVHARLVADAAIAFRALGVVGYGRADFRVRPDGNVCFLEMNPLPTLSPNDEDLYAAAAAYGHSPEDLLRAILDAPARLPRYDVDGQSSMTVSGTPWAIAR